jgi:hypothetical protein
LSPAFLSGWYLMARICLMYNKKNLKRGKTDRDNFYLVLGIYLLHLFKVWVIKWKNVN